MPARRLHRFCRPVIFGLALSLPLSSIAAEPKQAPQVAITAEPPVSYAPAENRHLRITVDAVITAGAKAYLPKDKNWLQLHVTVTNKGSDIVGFADLRERLSSGTVIPPAQAYTELNKPPSATASMAKTMGVGGAVQMAGMFIAPPLLLVGGVANLVGSTLGFDKRNKRNQQIQRTMLAPTAIAPGTSIQGVVYLPALKDHDGLIAFYTADGKLGSVALARNGVPQPAQPALEPIASPAPDASKGTPAEGPKTPKPRKTRKR